jgi:membrane protein
VVLRHFIEAQREGRQIDPERVRASEPRLPGTWIARYFDDLKRADVIRREDAGGWLFSRSLDSTDLLRVYAHSHYRLPMRPSQEAHANGIELPAELMALLDHAAQSLDASLATRLDQAYPPATPATRTSEDIRL